MTAPIDTITRLYLRPVPLHEQRTVRLLGARWDAERRLWWVGAEWGDLARFERWLP